MKKFLISAAAALMLLPMVVSCNGNSKSDLKTPGDSLSYYFGQMYGYGVAGEAKKGPDSAKFNKEEFMKGLEFVLSSDTANTSYNQGMALGVQLQQMMRQVKETQNVNIDTKLWLAAFKKAFMSDSLKDPNELQMKVMDLMKRVSAEAKAKDPKAIENKKAGEAFVAKMLKDPTIKKMPSGLCVKVVKEGNGKKFGPNDRIMVKYDGKHIDGKTFDNGQGQAVPMSPNGVVPGMKEALMMMSPGAHYIIIIPANLGYGAEGTGPIGPNETLLFDVQTLGVQPAQAAQGQPQGQPAPQQMR